MLSTKEVVSDSPCARASTAPILAFVHAWLDTWAGIGLIAAGMARQGYDN